MAIRSLRYRDDEVLRKKARKVEVIDDKILTLLDDMAETMYENNGVGLAAPQIGILKRIVVIDVGDGLLELINPEIVSESGTQISQEGCLSFPGLYGEVERPAKIVVKALNREGKEVTYTGTKLFAVCLSHEIDHLNGVVFVDKAKNLERID